MNHRGRHSCAGLPAAARGGARRWKHEPRARRGTILRSPRPAVPDSLRRLPRRNDSAGLCKLEQRRCAHGVALPCLSVALVPRVECRQIQPVHQTADMVRQMAFQQPLPYIRRQQQLWLRSVAAECRRHNVPSSSGSSTLVAPRFVRRRLLAARGGTPRCTEIGAAPAWQGATREQIGVFVTPAIRSPAPPDTGYSVKPQNSAGIECSGAFATGCQVGHQAR